MPKNQEKYNKPPLSIREQIDLLKSRGLVVTNDEALEYYLKNLSYYHLSIYFKHFQEDDVFYKGTSFEDVLSVYIFDNKLRFLLLELLERIEKSFKCRMAYELSVMTNNSHWHLDEGLFTNKQIHIEILEMISEECKKSREISIVHYKEAYSEPVTPPIWMLIEILSFGQCVKICKSLKREYKNKVSRTFDEDEQFIMSWMHCLFALRNNCAHNSRLWNRNFVFTPKSDHKIFDKYFITGSKKLFNQIVILQILLKKINPTSSWVIKLEELINEHNIDISQMGFPDDWENRLNLIISVN